jgi:choline dehydrogenase-like flavoprotein
MNVAVVGSGVSGLAVAQALVERGAKVTLLDVGETLDADRGAVVAKLKSLPVAEWSREDLAFLGDNPSFERGGLPKKMFFGSEQIYADERPFARTVSTAEGRAPFPTFMKGGFSNVWGTAVLPVDACDMADWPVSRAEMDPYFVRAARLIPLCGGAGTLSHAFPDYAQKLGDLDPGPQGEALLDDMRRVEDRLLAAGTLYGKARLAVHTAEDDDGALPCNGCGYCFTGCVRGSMFATVPGIERMARRGEIAYRPGLFVERIGESGAGVTVDGIDLRSAEQVAFCFDAIFLAAGPINTTRLLLRSRELYDRIVPMLESQKFVIPMLRRRGAKTAIEHPSVTLSSVFIETKIPSLSDHWLHVQVVPMNQLILDGISTLRRGGRAVKTLGKPIFRHLTIGWCGMHSDHSSRLELSLRRDEKGDRLDMSLCDLPAAKVAAGEAARHLFKTGLTFGTLFCHWAIKISNPGSGTHCGSSFPMRRQPTALLDTDVFGRPFGWSRVFAVDSAVLPSIPGTTLAFSVMANAMRIGSTAPLAT